MTTADTKKKPMPDNTLTLQLASEGDMVITHATPETEDTK